MCILFVQAMPKLYPSKLQRTQLVGNVFDTSRPAYLARSSSLKCWSHSCAEPLVPLDWREPSQSHCCRAAAGGQCTPPSVSYPHNLPNQEKAVCGSGAAVGWRASHPSVITAPLGGRASPPHQHHRAGETPETISLSLWHYD